MVFVLSCIPIAAMLIMIFWMTSSVLGTSTKEILKNTMTISESLDIRDRDRYLQTYFNLWKNQNIRTLSGVSTDLFYHSTAATLRLLGRMGLRREMVLRTPTESYSIADFSVTLGNVAWITQSLTGRYRERLVDSVTGAVLQNKDYRSTTVTINLNRNPNRTAGAAQCCFGCGTEMSVNGELFLCPNCGATYTSDSYDWVINQIAVQAPPEKNLLTIGTTIATCFCAALPVAGLISQGVPGMQPIITVLSILCILVVAGYAVYSVWYYGALKKLEKYDPLCSTFRMSERVMYLVQLFLQCRNDDRGRMRQFMDETAYQQWLQQDNGASGNHVVDQSLSGVAVFKDFTVSGGRQRMTVSLPLKLWVWNEQTRQMQITKRTVKLGVYRNEATRYRDKMTPELIICPGCGMSVNLTADGKCKFCGTGYDLADWDWKIEWLDNSLYL